MLAFFQAHLSMEGFEEYVTINGGVSTWGKGSSGAEVLFGKLGLVCLHVRLYVVFMSSRYLKVIHIQVQKDWRI